jgi:hypothetical protein
LPISDRDRRAREKARKRARIASSRGCLLRKCVLVRPRQSPSMRPFSRLSSRYDATKADSQCTRYRVNRNAVTILADPSKSMCEMGTNECAHVIRSRIFLPSLAGRISS